MTPPFSHFLILLRADAQLAAEGRAVLFGQRFGRPASGGGAPLAAQPSIFFLNAAMQPDQTEVK